jgi:hypothetical protein
MAIDAKHGNSDFIVFPAALPHGGAVLDPVTATVGH